MNLKNKLVKQKIFESWNKKISKHLAAKGISKISKSKMQRLCEAAQVRRMYENAATTANTPGRGAFSLGNNPSAAGDSTKGSEGQFDSLFGVFIDSFANTVGLDLIPTIQSTKSNMVVNVVEPIYAGGKLSATDADNMPNVFKVAIVQTGTNAALTAGTEYTVKDANDGDELLKITYVGKDRAKGHAIFRVGTVTGNGALASLLNTPVNDAAIFTDAGNFIGFNPSTVDYVGAYTNFIKGYSGAGLDDTDAFTANRSDGSMSSTGNSRETGESGRYRSMGLTKWSENFSMRTYQVKIGYTVEMLQDLAMEEGIDGAQLAFDAISNELEQSFNDEIITKVFNTGWGHHANFHAITGDNLNLHISATEQGATTTYLDEDDVQRSLPKASGALISTTNGDNLPSMQRRIVSRLTYASAVVGHRNRRGKANKVATNGRLSSALQDTRGFQDAPFENNLSENDNLYQVGTLRKMDVFEDPMMGLTDARISVSRKGTDQEPGIKMINYIMGETISTIAEGTMSEVSVLKSRAQVASVGTNPGFNYLTFTVTEGSGQSII